MSSYVRSARDRNWLFLSFSFTTELVEHQERSFQPVADAFVMVKESKLGKAELEVHCNL